MILPLDKALHKDNTDWGSNGHLTYNSGFGNEFETEAVAGALPIGQNNPKRCPFDLCAEQLSGTAFTLPRRANQRSWLYRKVPTVKHLPFEPYNGAWFLKTAREACVCIPNQLRWHPMDAPSAPVDFLDGMHTMCCSGDPASRDGYAIHIYAATQSMGARCLANADGDMLIVPQQGRILLRTELGRMVVAPGEICVVQRGIRFAVDLDAASSSPCCARGYVLELYSGHFTLPDLGPIGANGLANPRDFFVPVAWYEEEDQEYQVVHKLGGLLFAARQDNTPFNVVAWHGNYAPFKYDLTKFCPMNCVGFDHADPSIFTVLTCASAVPGQAVVDFVVFPPRWSVAEGTFRPPYFHRNTMSEFMGLIQGRYEAKQDGFMPGGSSLHVCMSPHGPDSQTYYANIDENSSSGPQKVQSDTLAFMFEVYALPMVTKQALSMPELDKEYYKCWQDLKYTGSLTSSAKESEQ